MHTNTDYFSSNNSLKQGTVDTSNVEKAKDAFLVLFLAYGVILV